MIFNSTLFHFPLWGCEPSVSHYFPQHILAWCFASFENRTQNNTKIHGRKSLLQGHIASLAPGLKKSLSGGWGGGGGGDPILFPFVIFGSIFQTQGRRILVHYQPLWQATSKQATTDTHTHTHKSSFGTPKLCGGGGGGGTIWYYVPHLQNRRGVFPPMQRKHSPFWPRGGGGGGTHLSTG